ncbi:hypothetical protein RUM43_011282 [Polyplax serrata]|uniref:Uncharacterized protein n=1 Tax=Polyplax serrata TaxID=468196 RepID=A0AAN8NLS6_POLSC
MNLETLLEAAKFVELQEVKQKKALQTFDARDDENCGKSPTLPNNIDRLIRSLIARVDLNPTG